jgi:signal recognition particle protein
MFESLSEKLSGILDKLTGRGALSEEDVNAAMREVRRALLEADVALEVVRSFVDRTRTKAVGASVIKSVRPGQMVVKIVHDSLVETLGTDSQAIDLNAPAPVAIMLVGLQGAGKTTTAAKIAKRLTERDKHKVLMASLDVKRPAAQEQLAVLGQQVGVATLPIVFGEDPVAIAKRAESAARLQGYDVVILDTAGRTHIDELLMQEMVDIRDASRPHEILLVADALTGQDAVNLAKNFNEQVGLTGIVLTRMDGDGRGGAALSMRAVTGKPIKLLGVGEKMDAIEDFHPARLADRILGMGDIVSLVEKAAQNIDMAQAAKMAEKMRKGVFDLNDLSEQLSQIEKLGGMGGIMGMLPGVAKIKDQLNSREAPARDHLVDDAAGAPQPRPSQGLAQEAHCDGLGRHGRICQPAAQAAPPDGGHDEGHGRRGRQARHDGQARADDWAWRGHADAIARADRSHAEAIGRRRSSGSAFGTARHSSRPAARRLQLPPAIPRSRRRREAAGPRWRLQPIRQEEMTSTTHLI